MSPKALLEPILEHGIRNTNFFEGRLLSGRDLQDQQVANRRHHRHLGRAIAAYREAERYLPNEDRLAANLKQALDRRADRFPEAGRSLIDHIFFWTRAVAYPTQFRLTLAAAALAFVLACFRLFWPRLKGVMPTLLGAAVAAVLLCAGSGLTAYRYEWITRGVLVAPKTEALKSPHGDGYESPDRQNP